MARAWLRSLPTPLRTLALPLGAALSIPLAAPPSRAYSPPDPATSAEAARGRAPYDRSCAACHGADLEGSSAPSLRGATFAAHWNGKDADALFTVISQRMPLGAPRSLPEADYRAIDAYILASNGYQDRDGRLSPAPASPETAPAGGVSGAPSPPKALLRPPAWPGAPAAAGPTDAEIDAEGREGWIGYNRDYQGTRYSPLRQINRSNVKALGPVCLFQLGETGTFESSPVIYEGRLYFTTAHNTYAIDGRTCRKIWEYDDVPEGPEPLPVNRGVALYHGAAFRGTPDGRLVSLDLRTGKLLWQVQAVDSTTGQYFSAAPVAFGGKVYIGAAGADAMQPGRIFAFDARTGRLDWSFDPIPTGRQPGAETWGAGQDVGGGSHWATITVDPAERRLYVPIGNPGSDLYGQARPGVNLYTDSVVVLDADSGRLLWYAQQVPHDLHDWDTAAAPTIYQIDGRKYMAEASKSGYLYLYSRDSHALMAKEETSSHRNEALVPTPAGTHVCPGILGGTEWNGAALDPQYRELIVPSVDWCVTVAVKPDAPDAFTRGFGGSVEFDRTGTGWLRAFDAVGGRPTWVDKMDSPMVAAVTATAGGLVFTGTTNGDFVGVDARTGRILYRFNTGGAISGGVTSYAIGGRQYVAVESGNTSRLSWKTTGGALLIVFALPVEEK